MYQSKSLLRIAAIGLIAFFFSPVRAQVMKLQLNERAYDAQYTRLMMANPVFGFNDDSAASPLDISSATKEDLTSWNKVVMPAYDKSIRMGFFWLFDGSAPGGFFENHTLVAISNPTFYLYHPTVIWTDRNHNLNFTDDGAADTFTDAKSIVLALGTNPNGYRVHLSHFPSDSFVQYSNLHLEEVLKVKGRRLYFGPGSDLRERRLNVIAGRWKGSTDSFSIAVKDVNCNGLYNDIGIDVVMISDYHAVFDNLQGVKLETGKKTYLEWNNVAYTVKQVDAEGGYIQFFRDTAAELKYSLNVGQKLPRFKYCTATKPQKHKGVRRLKGNYTYIYIWRDAAPDYIRDSASLHRLGRMAGKDFQVLALNYGSSGRYVVRYNHLFNTSIQQGFSSNQINRDLKVKRIPTGILVDKRQRIVAVGITPEQAESMLMRLSILPDK